MNNTRQASAVASFLVVAGLALCFGLASMSLEIFAPLDRGIQDAQARWLRHPIVTDVTIVEIDARSLQELNTWPWPRRYHAELIEALLARGASRIFVDIDFSSASNPTDDGLLARAINAGGQRMVLPMFWRPISAGASTLIRSEPLPALRKDALLGLVNLLPDSSGLVREIRALTPDADRAVAPVAYVLAGKSPAAVEPLLLDYRIEPSSFASLSFVDVLRAPHDTQDLKGRTVLVGATSSELNDMIQVPVYGALPGVLVQALALESLRHNDLRELSPLGMAALIVVWAIFVTLLMRGVAWRRAPLIAILLGAGTVGFSFLLHAEANLLLAPSGLLLTIAVALLGSLLKSLSSESWAAWSNWVNFRRQDALLAEIVTHSADAIVTLDSSGNVRTANPAAAQLFGRAVEALQGNSIESILPRGRELLERQSEGRLGAAETALIREDGHSVPLEVVIGRITVGDEHVMTMTLRDITVHRDRERELRFHATHDALTGLPNRVYLAERLGEILDARAPPRCWALVLIDLDGFKEINDTLGHSVGDLVLVELARRLCAQVPPGTCVVRLGGDEFAVLFEAQADGADLESRCSELLLVAAEPVIVKSIPVHLGMSAGVARWPGDADTAEALMQKADIALYAAKRNRSNLEFYEASSDHTSPRRLEMLALLRSAIANDEMSLHYQPKIALATGRICSVEALARWESPILGKVSPGEFIPLAEATDLITPLTQWTLRRALRDCRVWRAQGAQLQVAVNLSARHLQDARLPQVVQELLQASGAQPDWLELEITESAIMSDPDRAFRIVQALREIGISISIDDFGTGYSSLAYLQNLHIDRLKIDRSFVAGMTQAEGSRVIVESIVKLGQALGLQIVAEGIETETQRQQLDALGCDFGQGYLFSPALTSEALLRWCAEQPEFVWEHSPLRSVSASR